MLRGEEESSGQEGVNREGSNARDTEEEGIAGEKTGDVIGGYSMRCEATES